MPRPFIDISGTKVGSLIVQKYIGHGSSDKGYYWCVCDCGKEKKVRADHLRNKKIISCGCVGRLNSIKGSTKHGLSHNPLYFVWTAMMDRCYNVNFPDYKNYGGRGIVVCDRWKLSLADFVFDMSEGYQKGLQLDRVDNDKGYYKENCKWSTRKDNNRNKRTNVYLEVNGVTKLLIEWHEFTKIPYPSIAKRVQVGRTGEDALFGNHPEKIKLKYNIQW